MADAVYRTEPERARSTPHSVAPRAVIRELAKRGLRHTIPLFLLLVAEADGRACRLAQWALAGKLETTERTVRRHEAELVKAGYIQVVHGGPRNRRMVVLLAAAPRETNAPAPTQVLHSIPQSAVGSGHGRPVSRAPETGHAAPSHKEDRACPRARAETPLSVKPERAPREPFARTWTARLAAYVATAMPGSGSRMPEGPSPSPAVDDALQDLHEALGMWANTLRECGRHARAICGHEGEEAALTYLETLERWCLRFPAERRGRLALGALRARAARGGPGARQATMDGLFQDGAARERAGGAAPRA